MSTTNLSGEEVSLDCNPEAFRHQLEQDWAREDAYRWKQLLVLTLLGNGWSLANVARALKMNKNHLYRVVNNARSRIKDYAQEAGANLDPAKPTDCNFCKETRCD